MAGCVDVRLFGDLTTLLADLALLALLGAGGVLQDLEITILVLTAGELLDRAADQVGDLLIQVIHLARHGIVDLTADLIADPVAQLTGQELVHGIGHLVVHDITGACTQLVDLIRDQIGHAGQQVFLQAVHDLLGRPAAVHTLLCIGGCIFRNLAHLVHEGRVIHQLVLDLCTDFVQGGGTQLGLEELCVGLILHELVHGQLHSIIHQSASQIVPTSIRLHNFLRQLQHHITDGLRIVSCLFLVVSFADVIDCIVHGVVEHLIDTRLRCLTLRHIACQLVHYIYNGIFRQEAVIQTVFQVANRLVKRVQNTRINRNLYSIAHSDFQILQLTRHGIRDLIQCSKSLTLGHSVVFTGLISFFPCFLQSLIDDVSDILIQRHIRLSLIRLPLKFDVLQGKIRKAICDFFAFFSGKCIILMAAVIALALIVGNKFIVFPLRSINLIRGILVRQGIAIGTKVGTVSGLALGTTHGAAQRLGLLLTGGLIVVHILAPGVGDGLDLSRFHITAVDTDTLLLTLCIAGGFLGHFPLAIVMDDLLLFCAAITTITDCNLLTICALSGFLGHGIFGVQVAKGILPVCFSSFSFMELAFFNGISFFRAGGSNHMILLPIMKCPLIRITICSGLILLCHLPVLGQFRQGNGLVLLCHLPVLGQFRQGSGLVGLGIDVGFVSLRVGFLLLGLGRRGLHLVGVRRQYGSRRRQGKTNGQHQSGRTSAQFVDFSHVPSSFNCCRVSGFACRP